MYIIHVAGRDAFNEEIRTGFYGAASLKRCGFIHCSDLDTYYLVAPNFRDDPEDKVILVIDTDRLGSEVRREDGGGLDFPHIYGLLNREAIVDVLDHLWSPAREWIPNEELKPYAPDGFRREWKQETEQRPLSPLRLRPYKSCDSETIARWVREKDVFIRWGGGHFGEFPVSAGTIDEMYRLKNGNCSEPDNFYPWIALDEGNSVVGHFIMRYLHGDSRILRFGWVVVDSAARGKGYGTAMLRAGLKYAFELLGADRVTIGVYEGNEPARRCYLKAGFRDRETVKGEERNVIEMEITKTEYRAG